MSPAGPGATDVQRRRFILDALPAGSEGMEVGVHLGDFSQAILDVVRPRVLHLVDPWHHEPSPEYDRAWYGGKAEQGQQEMDQRHAGVLERFAPQIAAGTVVVHRGQSDAVLSQFEDDSLDWVYIDGNHRYEFVSEDLRLGLVKVRPGGLVTGDDYTEGGWWEGGVKRAVDELAAGSAARLVEIRQSQFIFEKPAGEGEGSS
jgi:hypothetical protein